MLKAIRHCRWQEGEVGRQKREKRDGRRREVIERLREIEGVRDGRRLREREGCPYVCQLPFKTRHRVENVYV